MCRRPFAREEVCPRSASSPPFAGLTDVLFFVLDQAYYLQAFEPTDEELCVAANMNVEEGRDDEDDEDADGTLGGFIVDDDAADDDGDYGTSQKKDKKKKVKMPNRAVVQSSDESEAEEESAPTRRTSTSKPPQQEKGKEKEVAPAQLTWAEVCLWPARRRTRPATDVPLRNEQQEPSTKILWAYNELDRMFKENPTGPFLDRQRDCPAPC